MSSDHERLSRRDFVMGAVALGGTSGLDLLDDVTVATAPSGTNQPATLPERQHAWNASLSQDAHGNHVLPRHHVLLFLKYEGEVPTATERETVESTLRSLERAYEWSNEGVLFTIGYSPYYFERFEWVYMPSYVDLPEPTTLSPFEDPEFDQHDALVHLASDNPKALVRAEEAVRGRRSTVNDVELTADFSGVFRVADRRTGFVGAGLPAKNQDVKGIPDGAPIPEQAPLFTGFKSNFRQNQASEDAITIPQGQFAGGTTQHVSKLSLDLIDWYGEDNHDDRVAKMFSPTHANNALVGNVGEKLTDSSGLTDEIIANTEKHARELGRVGHAQKTARARNADDTPLLLRRDFDSTDGDRAGVHFVSLQQGIGDFRYTREHMNGVDLAENTPLSEREGNGILDLFTVERRGNFLLPPRSLRALPPSHPDG